MFQSCNHLTNGAVSSCNDNIGDFLLQDLLRHAFVIAFFGGVDDFKWQPC